ncbi:MAG: cytochrome c [Phycisphaerales bacterium]|nr:cytochrome c [Phycisphaerales bacterium]
MLALATLTGCKEKQPEVTLGPPPDWIRTARPEQLYMLQCAQCHGPLDVVDGRVTVGISHRRVLVVGPWLYVAPQEGESEAHAMSRIILDGIPETEMLGFRRGLSEEKAIALAEWILEMRTLAAKNIADGATAPAKNDDEPVDEAPADEGQ